MAERPERPLHLLYATPFSGWERDNMPAALSRIGKWTPFYLGDEGFDDKDEETWLTQRDNLDSALCRFVETLHEREPVDAVISYLSGWYISAAPLRRIESLGIPTCAMWLDDRLSFEGCMRGGRLSGGADLAAAYTLNFTNAPDSVVKYLESGGLAVFLPQGANPEVYKPVDAPFEVEVSFVGACYGQRPDYVRYLQERGFRVEAYGPGWPAGRLDTRGMVDLYNRSRINLGFSGIGHSMKETCLKGRDFEVPMAGGLYLTTEQPDLHRVYRVGEEVVTYSNREDLAGKVRFLLDNPEYCQRVRKAARARSVRDHTWENRLRTLLFLVGLHPEESW